MDNKTATQVLYEHGIDVMSMYDSFNTQLLHAMGQYAAQQSIKEDGWVTEKPVFTEDCILLTANKVKDIWEYQSWKILESFYEDENGCSVFYWQWCNMDGEEYGDLADLKADQYKVISLLPSPPTIK